MFAPKYFPPNYYACLYWPPCPISADPVVTTGQGFEYSLPESRQHYSLERNTPQFSVIESPLEYSLPEGILHYSQSGMLHYTLEEED